MSPKYSTDSWMKLLAAGKAKSPERVDERCTLENMALSA
jgi:hypothetical protein